MKVVIGIALVIMLGCCGRKLDEELKGKNEALQLPTDSSRYEKVSGIEHFIDNTEYCKGDTFTLMLIVTSPVYVENSRSLKNLGGSVVRFRPFIPDTTTPTVPINPFAPPPPNLSVNPALTKYKISIYLPKSLPVPRAAFGHLVIVTFVCNKGKLNEGNTALSVQRFRIIGHGIQVSPLIQEPDTTSNIYDK